jgi:hypothetical protein
MFARLRELGFSFFKRISLIFVFGGLLFGRAAEAKPSSIPKRIAAVQKATQQLPADVRETVILRAQWGNWGNWRNWNNWSNWANWNNWNNWGNWGNWGNI